ncbi:AfsR/SARP family transcriptional regulator [Actinocorallia longicatena]|uniref:OmpR/PhoB-type domain-containing protein n=1 Tax=Actinocorallia longicatena TaxID=111803 RepID=A0ABP6QD72_9ACTN
MRFDVLGPLTVTTTEGAPVRVPDRKVRALLAHLLVHEGRAVSTDRLIDALWGENLPANPGNTLQTRVSQLRRVLADAEPGGKDLVVTQAPGYLLRDGAADVAAFRDLTARAREGTDARTRVALLTEALGLWRGQPYADVAEEPFARAVISRLDEERLTALEDRAEAQVELGEHDVARLAQLVAEHPFRERLRACHMHALYRSGRHSEALDTYHDLRKRLADELGLDPGPELEALHQAILTRDPAVSPTGTTNLPAGLTPLVGRDALVDGLLDRLTHSRLVTLTGPGGVGKTSAALETARRVQENAWLVELASLPARASAARVEAAVAEVADVTSGPVLLVLDNCEHVVDAAAAVAERLLRAAPRLRVLATSREPLGIFGEQTLPVPPLDLPPGEATADYSAVRLFAERAAVEVTPGNAAAIGEICRRLDGLPLALELAATRVHGLGVHELAARLDDRFRMLTTRQQTLHAVISWSWDLLTPVERTVLSRLSLHMDAFTLAAAEAVCASGEIPGHDVADALARLVDRSLVVRLEGMARYRLLETVRAFCLERLAPEIEETRSRYAAYYQGLSQRSEPRLYGYGELFSHVGAIYRQGPVEAPRPEISGAVQHAVSADGTPIAFQQWGEGPPVVLVANTMNDRRALAPLARRLARSFTAIVYDRRGRGGSGDTPPYAVEREIEDLAAVAGRFGGPVAGFGVTSGAVLLAEAAARGVPFGRLVLVEPPLILPGTREPVPADMIGRLDRLIAEGRRGDAVELFLTLNVQMAPEVLAPMRSAPRWQELEAVAHTIRYDLALLGDYGLPGRWATEIVQPVLVLAGEVSLAWRRATAEAVAALLPAARLLTMSGQPHDPHPDLLAPILEEFLLE